MNYNYNPKCTNIYCNGGIITRDGQTGRICRKCNPTIKTKRFKAGTYVHLDKETCVNSFSSYPSSRVFTVTSENNEYVWVNNCSKGVDHSKVKKATKKQIDAHIAIFKTMYTISGSAANLKQLMFAKLSYEKQTQ